MDLFINYFLKDFSQDYRVHHHYRHRLDRHLDRRRQGMEQVICVKFNYLFLFINLYIRQQYLEFLSELDYYYFNYEFFTIQYSNFPSQQFKYFFNALNHPYFDLPAVDLPAVILVHHLF